jgi:hypothetical protein
LQEKIKPINQHYHFFLFLKFLSTNSSKRTITALSITFFTGFKIKFFNNTSVWRSQEKAIKTVPISFGSAGELELWVA